MKALFNEVVGDAVVCSSALIGGVCVLITVLSKRIDAFVKRCSFPLVLWINNDGIYAMLKRLVITVTISTSAVKPFKY